MSSTSIKWDGSDWIDKFDLDMKAKQVSELEDVKFILYHEPHIIETIGYVHPLASLFEKIPNYNKSRNAYKTFVDILNKYNIFSAEVTEVLKRDHHVSRNLNQKLLELAKGTSRYIGDQVLKKENHKGISQEYKDEVMAKLDVETLVGIVFSRPHVFLKKDVDGVSLTVDKIEINPLSNMIFIRDQQIVTAKGLVIGNMMTTVRKFEKEVLKKCFEILNIKPVGITPEGCYIEGGDFITMSKDLAMMQIGIRSTIEGANYLMDNDLLGTKYFGVVKDERDRDQQRMHLDTIFNLIDEKNVIMLDFDDPTLPKNARRDIDIYEQKEPGGKYHLKETLDFEKYLVREGYNVIKASNKDQEEFMINFANIGKFDGKYVLVTSNAKFADVMKERKIDVVVEYVPEFKEVNKMHGSFHCVTQIFR